MAGNSTAEDTSLTSALKRIVRSYNAAGFLPVLLTVLLVAFAIFILVKQVNRLRLQEPTEPAPPPEAPRQEVLLAEIRDLLKARS